MKRHFEVQVRNPPVGVQLDVAAVMQRCEVGLRHEYWQSAATQYVKLPVECCAML